MGGDGDTSTIPDSKTQVGGVSIQCDNEKSVSATVLVLRTDGKELSMPPAVELHGDGGDHSDTGDSVDFLDVCPGSYKLTVKLADDSEEMTDFSFYDDRYGSRGFPIDVGDGGALIAVKLHPKACIRITNWRQPFAPYIEDAGITYEIFELTEEKVTAEISMRDEPDKVIYTRDLRSGEKSDGEHPLPWKGEVNKGDRAGGYALPGATYLVKLFTASGLQDQCETSVDAEIELERISWEDVYKSATGGKDPATLPLSESDTVKTKWIRYKLNEMGIYAGPIHERVDENLGKALMNYRLMRRMPINNKIVPKGSSLGDTPGHGLTAVDFAGYSGEMMYSWLYKFTGDDIAEGKLSSKRAELTRLLPEEMDQLIVFLSMEKPGKLFDDVDKLTTAGEDVRLNVDANRFYANFGAEFTEQKNAFERNTTDKYTFESSCIGTPCFALRAKVKIKDHADNSHDLPEELGEVPVHWKWEDQIDPRIDPNGSNPLPTATEERPSQTLEYVDKAIRAPWPNANPAYHNSRSAVGGMITDNADADYRIAFLKFDDGKKFTATTNEGVSVSAQGSDGAGIYVSTSIIAGDNYKITATIAVPGACASAETARVTIWRRFTIAAYIEWPARDANIAWNGQVLNEARWNETVEEFEHAYVQAPTFADLQVAKCTFNDLDRYGFKEKYLKRMTKVFSSKTAVQDLFQVNIRDPRLARECNKLWDAVRPVNRQLTRGYRFQVATPPQTELVELKRISTSWLAFASDDRKPAGEKYLEAITIIAPSGTVDTDLLADTCPKNNVLFNGVGKIKEIGLSYPESREDLWEAEKQMRKALNSFNSKYYGWLLRSPSDDNVIKNAIKSLEDATDPVTNMEGPFSASALSAWRHIRDVYLKALLLVANPTKTGFKPGLQKDQVAQYPSFGITGEVAMQNIREATVRPQLAFSGAHLLPKIVPNKAGNIPYTEAELRTEFNNISGPIGLPLTEDIDGVVRGGIRMEIEANLFKSRTSGPIIIDNLTHPELDAWSTDLTTGGNKTNEDGSRVTHKFRPMGFSMGNPLGVTFWSHCTPMRLSSVMTHEICHLWSMKHWHNAGGTQLDLHDQADVNCVMSYPIIGEGFDVDSWDQMPVKLLNELINRAVDNFREADGFGNVMNGLQLWVMREHFLSKNYHPHFCGKCNLQLRGWNILAHGTGGGPLLPKAVEVTDNDGVKVVTVSANHLPATKDDYDPRFFERDIPLPPPQD